jgi:hypothetical protein
MLRSLLSLIDVSDLCVTHALFAQAEKLELLKQIDDTKEHARKAAEEESAANAMLAALNEKVRMLEQTKAALGTQASQETSSECGCCYPRYFFMCSYGFSSLAKVTLLSYKHLA